MKQIEVRVRSGEVERVAAIGQRFGGADSVSYPAEVAGEAGWSVVLLSLTNESIGPCVAEVQEAVRDASIVIPATESIPLQTPLRDVRDRVADVSPRSTLELVLDVVQSVGSWRGMLLYAVVSGLVAAYGVMFNLWFLLTAAMLIAPVGAPTMVSVVGVTVGDGRILRRGALRFVVSLLLLAATAAALGLAYGIEAPTSLMETVTSLSLWSVLLGLAGGAAGAQALVQSEQDSMVTATATGFLVAVSLSPPSAVLGLAVALRRWEWVGLMAFLIALTFAGIMVGGWAALRMAGIRPEKPSARRGSRAMVRALVGGAVVALAGLFVLQTQLGPSFRKADITRRAAQVSRQAVEDLPGYTTLEVRARFTTTNARGAEGQALLVSVVAHSDQDPATPSRENAERALREVVTEAVLQELGPVHPFVQLSVLP